MLVLAEVGESCAVQELVEHWYTTRALLFVSVANSWELPKSEIQDINEIGSLCVTKWDGMCIEETEMGFDDLFGWYGNNFRARGHSKLMKIKYYGYTEYA